MYLPTQVKLTVPDGGLIRMTMYNVVASCCSAAPSRHDFCRYFTISSVL